MRIVNSQEDPDPLTSPGASSQYESGMSLSKSGGLGSKVSSAEVSGTLTRGERRDQGGRDMAPCAFENRELNTRKRRSGGRERSG
jgi:hypothetical protein